MGVKMAVRPRIRLDQKQKTRSDTGQSGFETVGLTGAAGATASSLGGRFGSQHHVARP